MGCACWGGGGLHVGGGGTLVHGGWHERRWGVVLVRRVCHVRCWAHLGHPHMHMWAVSRPMAGLPTPVTHPWFMVSPPPPMELRLVRWGRHCCGVSPLSSIAEFFMYQPPDRRVKSVGSKIGLWACIHFDF